MLSLLLLVGLLAIGAVYYAKNNPDSQAAQAGATVLSILAILAAIAFIFLNFTKADRQAKNHVAMFVDRERVRAEVAGDALKQLGATEAICVLDSNLTNALKDHEAGLSKAIGDAFPIHFTSLAQAGAQGQGKYYETFSPNQLVDLLAKHPKADMLISFITLPEELFANATFTQRNMKVAELIGIEPVLKKHLKNGWADYIVIDKPVTQRLSVKNRKITGNLGDAFAGEFIALP